LPARIISGNQRSFKTRADTLDIEKEGTQEKFPKGAGLMTEEEQGRAEENTKIRYDSFHK
jgi:hypothetical protein